MGTSLRIVTSLIGLMGMALLSVMCVLAQNPGDRTRSIYTDDNMNPLLVTAYAPSPDGKHISYAVNDEFYLVDTEKGSMNWVHQIKGLGITAIAFSPDGQSIIAGSRLMPQSMRTVNLSREIGDNLHIYDVQTGEIKVSVATHCAGRITDLIFSSDGTLLICGYRWLDIEGRLNFGIQVLDGRGGQPLSLIPVESQNVVSIALSPDGRLVAAAIGNTVNGVRSGEIRIWNTRTGGIEKIIKGCAGGANSVAFSSNGTALAAGSGVLSDTRMNSSLRVFETKNWQKQYEISSLKGPVTLLNYSSDGKWLAVGTLQGDSGVQSLATRIMLLNASSYETVTTLDGPDLLSNRLMFILRKNLISGLNLERAISFWDLTSGRFQGFLGAFAAEADSGPANMGRFIVSSNPVKSLAFFNSPDALFSGFENGDIRLWDTLKQQEMINYALSFPIKSLSLSRDGKWVAIGGREDGALTLMGLPGFKLKSIKQSHSGPITSISFSPDNRWMATGGADGNICFWRVPEFDLALKISAHQGGVNTISFSSDSKMLVSGGNDGVVALWDVMTGNRMETFNGHRAGVNAVAFSLDDETLASGGDDKIVIIWNLKRKKIEQILDKQKGKVYAVAFSSDGRRLASGGEAGCSTWAIKEKFRKQVLFTGQTTTATAIATAAYYNLPESVVTSLAFSPDGKVLACGSAAYTISLWDSSTGAFRGAFKKQAPATGR